MSTDPVTADKVPEPIDPPHDVVQLVDRFKKHAESYRSAEYLETRVRREFLDPFFAALGWDVDNRSGYAEAYKEVIHEDSIKVPGRDGGTKAPDYCFRIGGARKFFVEAKKPSVNIRADMDPAYQLRRYAWSAKLPLSLLTDFEELAVYDCRLKPAPTDSTSTARTLYLTIDQYLDPRRWAEIAGIFSKDAILKGSFDRYVDTSKRKRGTAEVDDALLNEIENWRELLAKALAKRNPQLNVYQLNHVVQATIDRIMFLRIAEDRGIEPYGTLLALTNGEGTYKRLFERFRLADQRYNSGLFHFEEERGRTGTPDEIAPDLQIDDKPLKQILKGLYYPESPYEFSVFAPEILGQVYEQFLGKVIRLTPAGLAKIEEKPEVKKAGGVFYTPAYIVDYVVEQTIGERLKEKTPADLCPLPHSPKPRAATAPSLSILDPACGSGSFLLGAYQYLLDWHLSQYVSRDPEQFATGKHPALYQRGRDDWRLTSFERKRILTSHIYGVDIDPQACEVTKLSLLLKVLEGENDESVGANLRLFHERALPDLTNNIKCGNALVGPDFYDQTQLSIVDDEKRLRVNAFDWSIEFPAIMQAGGFDVVIGNPPYVRMEAFKDLKDYLRTHYESHEERADLYSYFLELGHRVLKVGGAFGMIVSNKFVKSKYGKPLRSVLAKNAAIRRITDFAGARVFRGATVRTLVLATERSSGESSQAAEYVAPPSPEELKAFESGTMSVASFAASRIISLPATALGSGDWAFGSAATADLIQRLADSHTPLAKYPETKICRGVVSGLSKAFVIGAETYQSLVQEDPGVREIIVPVLNGRDIRRFHFEWPENHLIYTYHGIDVARHKGLLNYLAPFRKQLEDRATKQEWFELQQPQQRFVDFMKGPKIIFPDIAKQTRFALDTAGHFGTNTTYFIPGADLGLLGLLNSRFAQFYFQQVCAGLEGQDGVYLRFFGQYLENFPVPQAEDLKLGRGEEVKSLCQLVESVIQANQSRTATQTAHERSAIDRHIAVIERKIDQLVYGLYGLTDDEVRLVETATTRDE
jgi:hypothetical protein